MGRVYAEGLMPEIARRQFQPIIDRFLLALHRALPNVSREELAWNIHFALGAMAHTLLVRPEIYSEAASESPARVALRLIAFVSGGFRASASLEKEVEVNP
jgi:hypothetical protein